MNETQKNKIAAQTSTNESPGFKVQIMNVWCRGHGPEK